MPLLTRGTRRAGGVAQIAVRITGGSWAVSCVRGARCCEIALGDDAEVKFVLLLGGGGVRAGRVVLFVPVGRGRSRCARARRAGLRHLSNAPPFALRPTALMADGGRDRTWRAGLVRSARFAESKERLTQAGS